MVERNGCLYLIYAYDKSDADNVKLNILKKIVAEMNLDSATDSSSDSDA